MSRVARANKNITDRADRELGRVEQVGSIGELLKKERKALEYPESPGPDILLAGDRHAGFYGFVHPEEMGEIEDNPEGSKEFSGANIRLALGGLQGTTQFSDTPWMKFSSNGRIIYVPVKPFVRSISWNVIYEAGAVYGDDSIGTLPPNGRCGEELDIDGTDNSINISTDPDDGFLRDDAVLCSAGDTIVLAGWDESNNNGEFTVLGGEDEPTDTKIKVDGDLTTESGVRVSRIWNKDDEVTQNAQLTIGGLDYRVRLLRGAADDPTNSYGDSDRGSRGEANEWNLLMLPIHFRSLLGNWRYNSYAPEDVPNWEIGLSDEDLITHHTFGSGSYTWCQEARDDTQTYRRVRRGGAGGSDLHAFSTGSTASAHGFRPGLQLVSQ